MVGVAQVVQQNPKAEDTMSALIVKKIRVFPVPKCPECDGEMVLRRPKPNDTWEAFWGCKIFPHCRGSRNINADGSAMTDEEMEDARAARWEAQADDDEVYDRSPD